MRALADREQGVILPVVLVTLVAVSAVMGSFWQRVVQQSMLSPALFAHDNSRLLANRQLQAATSAIVRDPLALPMVSPSAVLPAAGASLETLTDNERGSASAQQPVWTQWSLVGATCPHRPGAPSPEGQLNGAAPQEPCIERVRFTVWAGQAGAWPRYVWQWQWQLHWGAGSSSGVPDVTEPIVRRVR